MRRGAGDQLILEAEQPRHIAHRVFHRVDPQIGGRAMPLAPGEMGRVFAAALMPFDDLHPGRFADDRDGGAQATLAEHFDKGLPSKAPDLLVIGKGEMDRARLGRKIGGEGDAGGDEPLHVATAAPI
jgi:hypothetical protein